jgi:hypothetical protein
MTDQDQTKIEKGTWAILEIFGHKVIAGYMTRDEFLGAPMIRLDIPETDDFPAFTRHYNPSAIYSITYVSEEAARMTAEQVTENPVSVYVPALGDLRRMQEENKTMREALEKIRASMRTPQIES